MIKPILAFLLLASCVSKPVFPDNTEQEKKCKKAYTEGAITYSEYQKCLTNK